MGHTSPTLGVGGNVLCKIVHFGLFRGAHASRVLVSASRRNNLFQSQASLANARRKRKSSRPRDALASTRDGCASQSRSLRYSLSRRLFASRNSPRRLLHPAKRKLSKSSCLPRVLIFRSISRLRV